MEELPNTKDTIRKLKSSLPICRVCLDVSMEYIEFEATLCVINNREITFSEGFHELIPDNGGLSQQNITNFCSTCGKDLLNAYLFMKRIEHTNDILKKVRNFIDESSMFLLDQHHNDYDNKIKTKQKDVIYFGNPGLEFGDQNDKNYQGDTEDIVKNNDSINSQSMCDESIKIEDLVQAECEFEYETICDPEVSMDKEEFLSEPETQCLENEIDELEHENNSESAMRMSTECGDLDRIEEENLEQHEIESHENYIECSSCDRLLKKKDLKSHMLKFQGYLNVDFRDKRTEKSLNYEFRHQNPETNFQKELDYKKCQYCRRMIRKSNMEKHLLTHSAGIKKSINCSVCDETFPTKIDLRQHFHSHANECNGYACQICGKICLKPFTLRNHIQAKHLSERRKHQCEDCGLFFSFPSLLKEHRRKHSMNNRFKCSHCDRTFVRKPQLDIHMRYHLNDFPYKCDQCDKCYVSKSNLTDHIRSKHTKITYDCERCKQKFKSQTGLRKHKYAHDGYPYNCPLCSVGQTSRSGMKQHLMGVHKDALTEAEFDIMFPIIIPKTGFRRPKHTYTNTINNQV